VQDILSLVTERLGFTAARYDIMPNLTLDDGFCFHRKIYGTGINASSGPWSEKGGVLILWNRLEQEGVGEITTSEALFAVPEQTVLSVYEDAPDADADADADAASSSTGEDEELRRHRRRQQEQEQQPGRGFGTNGTIGREQMSASSPYDHETAEMLQALNTATLCPPNNLRAWNCSRCANSSYFSRHFEFAPSEIQIVEAGGSSDGGSGGSSATLLALVAPDHGRRWVVVAVRGTVDAIITDWILDLELWQEPFDRRPSSPFAGMSSPVDNVMSNRSSFAIQFVHFSVQKQSATVPCFCKSKTVDLI
jgi:hypothetical protein